MALRIRHKVLLPALAIILVLMAPAAYSLWSIYQVKAHANLLSQNDFPARLTVGRMRNLFDDITLYGALAANMSDPGEYLPKFNELRSKFDAESVTLEHLDRDGPALLQADLNKAMARLYAAQLLHGSDPEILAEAERDARRILNDLQQHYTERVRNRITLLSGIGNFAAEFTLYALVAAMAVSGVVWVVILLSLSRPLRELVAGTERVARGRFNEPIPVRGQDELGRLSEAFNRMAASLNELDRMKAEFVATASHELKTPLTCIKGFASLLESGSKGPLTTGQRAILAQLQEQVDQMNDFVSQLLDLSRLRAGRVTMNLRSLPAGAFFSSVARGFEGVAERRRINYEISVDSNLPEKIWADPDRLREVINNLLGNAFKFTGADGRVAFRAECEDPGWVRVIVSDTGPGIPEEEIPFIFDRYYRGGDDSPRGREEGGAGLGLAISRGIVEKHGGTIWLERQNGPGARFVFRIPDAATAGRTLGRQRRLLAVKET